MFLIVDFDVCQTYVNVWGTYCHFPVFIYVDFSLLIAFFAGYTTSKYCHILVPDWKLDLCQKPSIINRGGCACSHLIAFISAQYGHDCTSSNGSLYSLDWITGLDYWTDLWSLTLATLVRILNPGWALLSFYLFWCCCC